MNCGSSKAAENHRYKKLTYTYDEGYIHQFQPKATHKVH